MARNDQREITGELLRYHRHFHTILDHLAEGIFHLSPEGRIIAVNRAGSDFCGSSESRLHGSFFCSFFEAPFRSRVEEVLLSAAALEDPAVLRHICLRQREFELRAIPLRVDGEQEVVAVLLDLNPQNRAGREPEDHQQERGELIGENTVRLREANSHLQEEIDRRLNIEKLLRRRLRLERLLTAISINLVKLHPEEIDLEIERCLRLLGAFFAVDRAMILLPDPTGQFISNTHEWCRPGIHSCKEMLQGLAISGFSWFLQRFSASEALALSSLDEIPPEAAIEKGILERQSIRSLVAFPFFDDRQSIGFLGLATVHEEKEWTSEYYFLLRMAGNVIAGALDRQRSQRQLQQSESRFKALFEQAADYALIAEPGPPGEFPIIIDANESACRIHGYSREELIGCSVVRICAPEDDFRQLREVTDQLQQGETVQTEMINIRRDGTTFPVESFIKPIEIDGRKYFYAIERDITERRRMEKALRESEALFREMAENFRGVLWVYDSKGRLLYISPGYRELFGRDPAELYMDLWAFLNYVHPSDRKALENERDHGQQAEIKLEYRIFHPDGSLRWLSERSFPIRDESGTIIRRFGITMDITENRITQEKLEESECLYRTLFETDMDGIAVCENTPAGGSPSMRIVDCNHTFSRLAGRGKKELFAIENIHTIQRFIKKKTGGPSHSMVSGVLSWMRPDRRENYIEFRQTEISIGRRVLIYCVHRDITGSLKAEENIRHLSRRLIQVAEEEQKRIARDLHDEFGQVLPQIRYSIEAVQNRIAGGQEEKREEFRRIFGQFEQLGNICRNIAGKLRSDILDRLGLIPAVQECICDFKEFNPGISIDFQVIGTGRSPAYDTDIVIYRILQEALNNIHKHAKADRVEILITFSHPNVILTVRDNGKGFAQGRRIYPRNAKEGLGLFGMRERVLALGGKLNILSREGTGTVIRAVLPLRMEELNGTD